MMYGSSLGTFHHHHQQQQQTQHQQLPQHSLNGDPDASTATTKLTFDANKNQIESQIQRRPSSLDLTSSDSATVVGDCDSATTSTFDEPHGYAEKLHGNANKAITAKTELLELDDDEQSYQQLQRLSTETTASAPAALAEALDTDVFIKQEDARKVMIFCDCKVFRMYQLLGLHVAEDVH